jgi:hypothetical protein
MGKEIVEAIKHYYGLATDEERRGCAKALHYLYHITDDNDLRLEIVNEMNALNYCIECGNKLQWYEWEEPVEELGYVNYELKGAYDCPYCGDVHE